MTAIELILKQLESGSRLLVSGRVEAPARIEQLTIIPRYGKPQALPTYLFVDLYPHLAEVRRDDQSAVYTLRFPQ